MKKKICNTVAGTLQAACTAHEAAADELDGGETVAAAAKTTTPTEETQA